MFCLGQKHSMNVEALALEAKSADMGHRTLEALKALHEVSLTTWVGTGLREFQLDYNHDTVNIIGLTDSCS